MQTLKPRRWAGTLLVTLCLLAPGLTMAQEQYGSDYIIVAPGMTLTKIMREYYPQHRRFWPELMDEIIRTNPHAFVNGAPASLKRGMRLTLPKDVPTTRTARQGSVSTTAPRTQTARQSTAPTVRPRTSTGAAAAATGAAAAARSSSAQRSTTQSRRQPAATQQPRPTQTFQGSPTITAQEPATVLPPPIETAQVDSDDDGPVGSAEIVAQDAPAGGGSSERPPWWWIVSALAMVALVL